MIIQVPWVKKGLTCETSQAADTQRDQRNVGYTMGALFC